MSVVSKADCANSTVAPPLELPHRSTPSNALGSPINLSTPVPFSVGSNRLVTSPVVGEVRGWFTNLFNWKSGGQGMFYSIHDLSRSRMDIARILESFGVTIESIGSTTATDANHGDVLRCRIDLVTTDSVTGTTWKPTRFRVEFSSGPPETPLSPRENVYQPNNILGGNSSVAPRGRVTSFMGRATSSNTPLPSPAPSHLVHIPPGYACAVIMVHEKGSITTFKAVWRRLKELYVDIPSAHLQCFSPTMPTTPFSDNTPGLVLN